MLEEGAQNSGPHMGPIPDREINGVELNVKVHVLDHCITPTGSHYIKDTSSLGVDDLFCVTPPSLTQRNPRKYTNPLGRSNALSALY